MKVLFLCGLVLVGALLVDAGSQELCALSPEEIKKVLTCMGDHVNSELKGKAKEIIHSQGDNLAQLVKRQCEAEVDFLELLKTAFSDEEAEAIKKAYGECKPASG
ncbi:antimicrobial peptide microplusin-like [Dermacentor albipictus]|uniref:antimicrobial peptide microplusin-like n=1 Tax=Dermacentor albipictus TaxID=60249 RepID=UPI0031FBCA4C